MSRNPPGFFQGTEMPDAGWWESLWPDPAAVLAAVGVKPGAEAVDLCCGDGWFTLQLAKIARHVLAVDIDPGLLKIAQTRLTESGVSNCGYLAGDACELATLAPRPFEFCVHGKRLSRRSRPLAADSCRARDAKTRRTVRYRQLAPAPARRNGRARPAPRASNRFTALPRGHNRGRGIRGTAASGSRRTAALSLCGAVRAASSLKTRSCLPS
jgi:hypothetical protein